MRVRITVVPTLPADVLPLARLAESTGIDGIGIADSPALHGPCYPTVQHVLAGTDTLSVGPVVVNPVTQHPSGHAATLWALRSLAPGRVFAGVGTGDSAVSSVGLAPAGPDQLADCVTTIRQRVPSVPVLVAIGGGRAASRVPPAATGVILGGGLDPEWMGHLVGLAERSAGHRLQRWAFVIASLDDALRPERRRAEVLGSVLTVARHSLAGDLARKGVPADLRPGLRDLLDRYDVRQHGRLDGANAELLAGRPRQRDYLVDRFAVTDPEAAASRLADVSRVLPLDGVLLTTTVADRMGHVRRIGRDLVPRLRAIGGPAAG